MAVTTAGVDTERAEAFERRITADLATGLHLAAVLMGDRLGLYAALAGGLRVTAAELAGRTGTHEPYVAAWLAAQAAAGYLDHDGDRGTFGLAPEHEAALLDRGGLLSAVGAFQIAAAAIKDEPLVTEAFRTGDGVAWHEHHPDLFVGYERFFGSSYARHLTREWIPALGDVERRLQNGATVADIGCRRGTTTLLMAAAYPRSTFVGCDTHEPSIAAARRACEEAGLDAAARFSVAGPADVAAGSQDLVTTSDYLGYVRDPVEAGAAVRAALAPDGAWLIAEPRAGDTLAVAVDPVEAAVRTAAALISAPAGAGAPAPGPARLREVVLAAGFGVVRHVATTSVHLVFEARNHGSSSRRRE